MARIDHQHGVKSTFFFLLSSEYNIFERDQAAVINEVIKLGHDLGLHYDVSLLEERRARSDLIHNVLQAQIWLMERCFDAPVVAMSAHLPQYASGTYGLRDVIDVYTEAPSSVISAIVDSSGGME